MAGDWIKIGHATPDKPEVVELAESLRIDHDAAFGKCVRLWIWADQQTVDGNDLTVTPSFIDRLTNCPGFSAALLNVGWLKSRNGRFSIPHFDRHNGQTAKNRALTKDRVKRSRNDSGVTKPSPEKRREEKREKTLAARPREPNVLWDAVAEIWFAGNVPPPDESRVGKIVKRLQQHGATPEDIRLRRRRYIAEWPEAECTPEALLKHWVRFGIAGKTGHDAGRQREKAEATFRAMEARRGEQEFMRAQQERAARVQGAAP